jgi:uncharacterized membrane protein
MPILLYNVSWMLYNCFLAILALGFGYFFLVSNNSIVKVIFGILWILFLPNTIYIFTDLVHLIDQWPLLSQQYRILLIVQYIILQFVGLVTFLFSLYPFETIILPRNLHKRKKVRYVIIFNFFIAFAMVLGRVERINSWDVVLRPTIVISSAFHVLFSLNLVGLLILFGLLCNCFYFLFRGWVLHTAKRFSEVLD